MNAACHDDQVLWCASVDTGTAGAVHQCLQSHLEELSVDCQAAEFEVAMRQFENVQVDSTLLNQCADEIATQCKGVKLGEGSVLQCLQDVLLNQIGGGDKKMGPQCAATVKKRLSLELRNSALNFKMMAVCEADIVALKCSDPGGKLDIGSDVFDCLADQQVEIKQRACAEQIVSMIRLQVSDIGFDHDANTACDTDLATFCSDVDPAEVGARQKCLQAHFRDLSRECFETEFKTVQRAVLTHDIRAQPSLNIACRHDIRAKCKSFNLDSVLSCLVDADPTTLSAACAQELGEYQVLVAKYMELDLRFQSSCSAKLDMCADVSGISPAERAEGSLADCFVSKYDKIPEGACRDAVLQIMKNRANNVEVDPSLHSACRDDREEFCSQVQNQHGEVHECLRDHIDQLDPGCRLAEQREMQIESTNIVLKAHLYAVCHSDLDAFCTTGLDASKLNGLQCLQKHRLDAGFSVGCLEAITKDMIISSKNWMALPFLQNECKDDVQRLCGENQRLDASMARWGKSSNAVLACLASSVSLRRIRDENCRHLVVEHVRAQAADLRLSPTISAACEHDMYRWCANVDPRHEAMHRCLREHFSNLEGACVRAEFMQMVLEKEIPGPKLNPGEVQAEQDADVAWSQDASMMLKDCNIEAKEMCWEQLASGDPTNLRDCLENHINANDVELGGSGELPLGVSQPCAVRVRMSVQLEQVDIRLTPQMLSHCAVDLVRNCLPVLQANEVNIAGKDADDELAPNTSSTMLLDLGPNPSDEYTSCLMRHIKDVKDSRCMKDLHRRARQQLQNPHSMARFSTACENDIVVICTQIHDQIEADSSMPCLMQLQDAEKMQSGGLLRAKPIGPLLSASCAAFLKEEVAMRQLVIDVASEFSKSALSAALSRKSGGKIDPRRWDALLGSVRDISSSKLAQDSPVKKGTELLQGLSGDPLESMLVEHVQALSSIEGGGTDHSFLVISGAFAKVAFAAFLLLCGVAVAVGISTARQAQSGVSVNKLG